MTLFWENKTAELSLPSQGAPVVEWPSGPVNCSPPSRSASAALRPVSNGMAPPLCLPSPTLGKWGSVCLLFCRAVCPVYHCHITETHRKRRTEGGSAVQSVLLWALRPRPHVASTPPWSHTSPSLPFGHRRLLYLLSPAAKMCVCAAN